MSDCTNDGVNTEEQCTCLVNSIGDSYDSYDDLDNLIKKSEESPEDLTVEEAGLLATFITEATSCGLTFD